MSHVIQWLKRALCPLHWTSSLLQSQLGLQEQSHMKCRMRHDAYALFQTPVAGQHLKGRTKKGRSSGTTRIQTAWAKGGEQNAANRCPALVVEAEGEVLGLSCNGDLPKQRSKRCCWMLGKTWMWRRSQKSMTTQKTCSFVQPKAHFSSNKKLWESWNLTISFEFLVPQSWSLSCFTCTQNWGLNQSEQLQRREGPCGPQKFWREKLPSGQMLMEISMTSQVTT